MLTVRAVHPCELLCNTSSPNVWFLWRSLVRDDPSGPHHFASTCFFSIDHLEYLHLFDAFLLFSFGLIDQSYRNASFLGVASTTLSISWLLSSTVSFMALCRRRRMLSTFEMTDIDGPDSLSRMIGPLHPVLFWMFFVIGSSTLLPTNSRTNPSPCAPCPRHKSHVDSS